VKTEKKHEALGKTRDVQTTDQDRQMRHGGEVRGDWPAMAFLPCIMAPASLLQWIRVQGHPVAA